MVRDVIKQKHLVQYAGFPTLKLQEAKGYNNKHNDNDDREYEAIVDTQVLHIHFSVATDRANFSLPFFYFFPNIIDES